MFVVHVGRRHHCAVGQPALAVHADVQLHAKEPLLALPGLVHLGVACFVCVLGRAGCTNDGGVHDSAGIDLEATCLELLANLGKQRLTQFVVIEQLTKLGDGCGVRYVLMPQVNTNKTTQAARSARCGVSCDQCLSGSAGCCTRQRMLDSGFWRLRCCQSAAGSPVCISLS